MRFEPRKEISGLPDTVHGGQGWRYEGVEDFSQNLNPYGPPEGLADAVRESLAETGHYPDASNEAPRRAVAEAYKVSPDCVCMGAGSSEIIRDFPNVFCEKGDSVLIMRPSFAEYSQQCAIAGVNVDYLDLRPGNDFRIPPEEIFEKLRSKRYKAVYICNPNNPTGRITEREELLDIVQEASDLGTLVFLDETLLDLSPEPEERTLVPFVKRSDNLLIARSYTKSFAVPGMRIGYCIAPPELASEMRKVQLPWNLGTVEQAAAIYLAGQRDYVKKASADLEAETERMTSELSEIGFPCDPSDTFYRFVSVEDLGLSGKEMQERMLQHRIMVRDCASFGFPGYIRYCAKDRPRDDAFIAAAKAVMKGTEGR